MINEIEKLKFDLEMTSKVSRSNEKVYSPVDMEEARNLKEELRDS